MEVPVSERHHKGDKTAAATLSPFGDKRTSPSCFARLRHVVAKSLLGGVQSVAPKKHREGRRSVAVPTSRPFGAPTERRTSREGFP